MAWARILSHERSAEFTMEDFEALISELKPKTVCYGYVLYSPILLLFFSFGFGYWLDADCLIFFCRFGAVLCDFEVRDAISKVLMGKDS